MMKRTAWLSTAIVATLLMSITTITASAQWDRRYRMSEREVREIGYRNGYQFGMREARQDRRSRDNYDFKRSRIYRDGMYGYRDEYHHDGNYKTGFRNGFEAGYREAFNNSGWGWGGWGRRDRDGDWRRRDDDWWCRSGDGRRY